MAQFRKGQRVVHPDFGLGTVMKDEEPERLAIRFDRLERELVALKHAELRLATPEDEAPEPVIEWLDTFEFEAPDTPHYHGSHWKPFFDEARQILVRLPEILPQSLVMTGFADDRPAPRDIPGDWRKARYLSWPLRERGILAVVAARQDGTSEVASLYPAVSIGTEVTLTLKRAIVWKGGVEAQIEASLGDASVCFFDTLYCMNRAWYQAGEKFQFILAGIAYSARPAPDEVIRVPDGAWDRFIRKEAVRDGLDHDDPSLYEIHTQGMAMFLPVAEWDRDEYQFRGTVKSVRETEMLSQPSWLVRTTVLRALADNAEQDLDILVTRKVWGDQPPPKVGDDIEGAIWLQGHLWYPHRWHKPDY
jgi:hypothetical protein